MRKFACIFVLSAIIISMACSTDVEGFKKVMGEWVMNHTEALEVFKLQQRVYMYFDDRVGDQECADIVDQEIDNATLNAAVEWEADKSKIDSVASHLLNEVLVPIFVSFKHCANPNIYRKEENAFNDATEEVLTNNSLINKAYRAFDDDILSTGLLPENKDCVKSISNLIELYRLGGIAQFTAKANNAYLFVANIVYVKFNVFTKMGQKCLIGSDSDKFNKALEYWFSKNPAQKAVFDQLDDMVSSLTKKLPHDNQCVKKLSAKLNSHLADAYARFGNGTSTITELGHAFLYIYLPELIDGAKGCLTTGEFY